VVFCKETEKWWFFETLTPNVVVFCNFLTARQRQHHGSDADRERDFAVCRPPPPQVTCCLSPSSSPPQLPPPQISPIRLCSAAVRSAFHRSAAASSSSQLKKQSCCTHVRLLPHPPARLRPLRACRSTAVSSPSLPQNRHGQRSLQFVPRKQRQQTTCKAQKITVIIESEAIIELHTPLILLLCVYLHILGKEKLVPLCHLMKNLSKDNNLAEHRILVLQPCIAKLMPNWLYCTQRKTDSQGKMPRSKQISFLL
jgi:hypothetical protein